MSSDSGCPVPPSCRQRATVPVVPRACQRLTSALRAAHRACGGTSLLCLSPDDVGRGASFHGLTFHLSVFLAELSAYVFCPSILAEVEVTYDIISVPGAQHSDSAFITHCEVPATRELTALCHRTRSSPYSQLSSRCCALLPVFNQAVHFLIVGF